jgi:hypothetical protein
MMPRCAKDGIFMVFPQSCAVRPPGSKTSILRDVLPAALGHATNASTPFQDYLHQHPLWQVFSWPDCTGATHLRPLATTETGPNGPNCWKSDISHRRCDHECRQ